MSALSGITTLQIVAYACSMFVSCESVIHYPRAFAFGIHSTIPSVTSLEVFTVMSKSLRQRVMTACLTASLGLTAVPAAHAVPATDAEDSAAAKPSLESCGPVLGTVGAVAALGLGAKAAEPLVAPYAKSINAEFLKAQQQFQKLARSANLPYEPLFGQGNGNDVFSSIAQQWNMLSQSGANITGASSNIDPKIVQQLGAGALTAAGVTALLFAPGVCGENSLFETLTQAGFSSSKVITPKPGADGKDGKDGKDGVDGKDGKSPTAVVVDNGDGTHTIIITNPDGSVTQTAVKDGKDGKSPTVEIIDNGDGSHAVTITRPDGTQSTTVIRDGKDGKDGAVGKDGKDGKDGISPTVDVTDNGDGTHTIKVVNPDGSVAQTVVKDGKNGKSPVAEVIDNGDGSHTVRITNPDGSVAETIVFDGKDGRDGKDGKDGASPTAEVIDNGDGTHTVKITNPDGSVTETAIQDGKDGKDGTSPVAEVIDNGDGTHTVRVTNSDGSVTETIVSNGKNGADGKDGKDGKSPTAEIINNGDGTHTVKITNPDGAVTETAIQDGKDGTSPTAEVIDNGDGSHTVRVTNSDGSVTETIVSDGKDGKDGANGADGVDGKAATVKVEPGVQDDKAGVWIISYFDANGDGEFTEDEEVGRQFVENGAKGVDGADGADGKDGFNALIKTETGTDAEGQTGTWVYTGVDKNDNGTLDENEISNKEFIANGAAGQDGKNGADGKDGADGQDGKNGKDGHSVMIDMAKETKTAVNRCKVTDTELLTVATYRDIDNDGVVSEDEKRDHKLQQEVLQGAITSVKLVDYLKRPDADRSLFNVFVWEDWNAPVLVENYDPALLEAGSYPGGGSGGYSGGGGGGSAGWGPTYDGKTVSITVGGTGDPYSDNTCIGPMLGGGF